MTRTRTSRFGRGTAAHLRLRTLENEPSRATDPTSEKRPDRASGSRPGFQFGFSRKLAAAAGVAALLLLPLGVIVANAQDAALPSRSVVQPGDTPDRVAVEFVVDPAAILATGAT